MIIPAHLVLFLLADDRMFFFFFPHIDVYGVHFWYFDNFDEKNAYSFLCEKGRCDIFDLPSAATSLTGTPFNSAMYPSTEKMTKPA